MQNSSLTSERDPYLWKQAKAHVGFKMHLRTYLLINAGLWLIWAFTSFFIFRDASRTLFPWPLFATLGWGIGLTSHYFGVYRSGNEKSMIEQEYQKLINQR
ncbi:2TM domain-containing protein [Spirosoma taeanense]|uniref:2TM domain-containing protein n=1 Tax=Spirosoma taeanense TaxID=2735870 RepID=A0A6M5YBQ2_9BACT|nr:2TM domain-containing protein [Spirosoma taeanense]QJW90693.1 2TM domain-containing protein [Spirosoma taeanense]